MQQCCHPPRLLTDLPIAHVNPSSYGAKKMDNPAHTLVHLLLSMCVFNSKIHMANPAHTLAIFILAMFPHPQDIPPPTANTSLSRRNLTPETP
jgi:hypothetical protein